jgi:hypothetical protein
MGQARCSRHLPWLAFHLLQLWKGWEMRKIVCMVLGLLSIAIWLTACSTGAQAPPIPAGADSDLNTFVYFYSDN